jgi:hypothetical protein
VIWLLVRSILPPTHRDDLAVGAWLLIPPLNKEAVTFERKPSYCHFGGERMANKCVWLAGVMALGMTCGASVGQTLAAPAKALDTVEVFEKVCLNTALSSDKAAAAAKTLGIDLATHVEESVTITLGADVTFGLWVVMVPGQICSVATPSHNAAGLTDRFLTTIGQRAGSAPAGPTPFKATVDGRVYVFHWQHDKGMDLLLMGQPSD